MPYGQDDLHIEILERDTDLGKYSPPYSAFSSWLQFDNPHEPPDCPGALWLAVEGGVVAGNLGAIAQHLEIEGSGVSGRYLMALAVDPSFRRRGIASLLLGHVLTQQDVMLMVGMTEAARKVYEKLGYLHLGRAVQQFRVVNTLAFVRLVGDHGRLEGLRPFMQSRFVDACIRGERALPRGRRRATSRMQIQSERPSTAALDTLWAQVKGSFSAIARRDAAWVRWRYWQCPTIDYGEYYAFDERGDLVGFLMSKRFENPSGVIVGVIVDALVKNHDAATFGELVDRATRDLESAGVDVVKCTFTMEWARAELRRRRFWDPLRMLPEDRRSGREVFVAGRVPVPTALDDWWLTRGDSEQDFNDAPPGSVALTPR